MGNPSIAPFPSLWQACKGRFTLCLTDLRLLLQDSLAGWSKHNATRMGAALAFYTLLSLVPLLLVAISIAGLIYGDKAAQTGMIAQMQFMIGPQRAKIVAALLDGAQNKADGVLATLLGAGTLMFGATAVLSELRGALNNVWEVPAKQLSARQELAGMVKEKLWSLAVVTGIIILLTGSLMVNTWIAALGAMASILPGHEVLLHLLSGLLQFVVITALFAATYKIVPQVPIAWPDVALGAAVTSLLFTLGNLLLGLYLGKASLSSTYGAAASTVIFAMWVYYSSQAFFFGAEFTRAFKVHRDRRLGLGAAEAD